MTTKLSTLALTALITTGFVGTAFAQEEDPFADDSDSMDIPAEPAPAASSEPAASSDGGGDFPQMAISTAFPTGGDTGRASLLWGLDTDTYLDIAFGFNINKGPDPAMPMDSATTIGTDIGVGYRMYKPSEGKIRPYMEPLVRLAIGDFSEAGDTLTLGVGAIMGVDYALMDQFTLGVGIGAGIVFADSFDTISLGLFTNNINATFWW
ncbi:MAG: hypothetical protein JKY56_02635 [Kofleriaceae bacterium]|nr:hypothetical protein [Kofleriaceae bacterium]